MDLVHNIYSALIVNDFDSGKLCARFIPFSGGPRKCVGDQFALLEAVVALAIILQHLNFELIPDQNISMTTGATIHTANVIFLILRLSSGTLEYSEHAF